MQLELLATFHLDNFEFLYARLDVKMDFSLFLQPRFLTEFSP